MYKHYDMCKHYDMYKLNNVDLNVSDFFFFFKNEICFCIILSFQMHCPEFCLVCWNQSCEANFYKLKFTH